MKNDTNDRSRHYQQLLDAQAAVFPGSDHEDYLDFRIQLVDGVAFLHVGDACYDTDHSGTWGSGSVGPVDTHGDVWDALSDAYDQADA